MAEITTVHASGQDAPDPEYLRRRRLSDRIYASTPGGSNRAPILIDDFDLSHLAWMDRANCRGTDGEAFFPGKGEGVDPIVKAICDACPVQLTCLEYAVERPQLKGVWGGIGDEERNRMRERAKSTQKRARRHAAP